MAPSGGFTGLTGADKGPLLVLLYFARGEVSVRIYILTTKHVDFVCVNHSML